MNVFDALAIRKIRNQVREYMTHDTSHIGVVRQLWWWWFEGRKLASILVRDEHNNAVAYGLITMRQGKLWLSGGVVKAFRGKGLGQHLFTQLIAHVESQGYEPWLDVRQDNKVARNLYRKLGFVRYGRYKDGIVRMVRRAK